MEVVENLLEELESSFLKLLCPVVDLRHVLHVLCVVGVQLRQRLFVPDLCDLGVLATLLHLLVKLL